VKKHRRKVASSPAALKHPLARLEELRRTLAGASNVSAVFLLVPGADCRGLPVLRLYGGALRLHRRRLSSRGSPILRCHSGRGRCLPCRTRQG
jgi:hypothetical protein